MNVKWVVHDAMLRNTSYQNLEEIVRAQGHDYYLIKDYSLKDELDQFDLPSINDCVIPICSLNLMRELKHYFGMYVNEHNLKYHVYTSLIGLPYQMFLNWNAHLTTYGNFKQRPDYWFNMYGAAEDKIFIRPDSGIKLFTGHCFQKYDWNHEINFLETTSVTDDSLIWVNYAKTFWDEARFIICGDQVVDGSRYATSDGDVLIEDKNFPSEYWRLAEKVAMGVWKPDEAFVLDICMTHGGPKIVEINSFNCAGFYACDAGKIVRAVSDHTIKIWKEQYE